VSWHTFSGVSEPSKARARVSPRVNMAARDSAHTSRTISAWICDRVGHSNVSWSRASGAWAVETTAAHNYLARSTLPARAHTAAAVDLARAYREYMLMQQFDLGFDLANLSRRARAWLQALNMCPDIMCTKSDRRALLVKAPEMYPACSHGVCVHVAGSRRGRARGTELVGGLASVIHSEKAHVED
jgi:hypothetical protein